MENLRNILIVHNYYQQPGGEDQVFSAESALLEMHGHRVHRYTISNDAVPEYSKLKLFKSTIWNQSVANELVKIVKESGIEIVHFHNTFPLISPAAYYAIQSLDVPVVQTLHNFRLMCSNAIFFRDGKPCEDCLGKIFPYPAVYHKCYRNDLKASSTVALMTLIHRIMRTWSRQVDLFVALTDFARRKFIQGGIPEDKIFVKPNFVHPDPGISSENGDYYLYVGRLSPEKGIENLIKLWAQLSSDYQLKIIGDGPLSPVIGRATDNMSNIEWLGKLEKNDVIEYMKKSKALIFPSTCYEGFPMVIAESYAVGLPVISNDIGSMSTIVRDTKTGMLCHPEDMSDWIKKIVWVNHHPEHLAKMRADARQEFEENYSSEVNYKLLMIAYELALKNSKENVRS